MVKIAAGAALLWLFTVACSSSQEAGEYDKYSGATHVIECKHWSNSCHFKAQERCRKGYVVKSLVETEKTGGVHGRYRSYILTARCN